MQAGCFSDFRPNYAGGIGAAAVQVPCSITLSASMTTTARGSKSKEECMCSAGFYTLPGITSLSACLSCDVGFWCRGGIYPPIACANGGSTVDTQTYNPLQCQCQSRTHGLTCAACSASSMCYHTSKFTPTVMAFHLAGWGLLQLTRLFFLYSSFCIFCIFCI